MNCTSTKPSSPQGEGFEMIGRLEVDPTHSRSSVRHSCASRNPLSYISGSLSLQGQSLDSRFHGNNNSDDILFRCS
jgi:hypothetical protein